MPTPAVVVEPAVDEERLADIEELLAKFISDTPRPGYFFQVGEDNDLLDLVREALDTVAPHTEAARFLYMYCLQSGPRWNMRLYGTPSTTLAFPKEYLVPGKNIGVRVAFLRRNEDAHALMLQGRMPVMVVDPVKGSVIIADDYPNSYGLLWFPPVDAESLESGEPTCAPFSWDDGSSTIDPPPPLLELLEPQQEAA
jgi:hypothetical protein